MTTKPNSEAETLAGKIAEAWRGATPTAADYRSGADAELAAILPILSDTLARKDAENVRLRDRLAMCAYSGPLAAPPSGTPEKACGHGLKFSERCRDCDEIAAAESPRHHCGLTGWNPMTDDACPACAAPFTSEEADLVSKFIEHTRSPDPPAAPVCRVCRTKVAGLPTPGYVHDPGCENASSSQRLAVVEPTEYHYTRISHRYESNQDPISPCCKVCGERGFSRLHVPKPADPQPVTRHVFVPHEPATGAATSHCQYGDGPTFCGKPASDPCHLQETLLDRIRAGKPLERSPELRAMAQRVVEVAATVGATDVEEWARALAEDVADAND